MDSDPKTNKSCPKLINNSKGFFDHLVHKLILKLISK